MSAEKLHVVRSDVAPSPRKLGVHGAAMWAAIHAHYLIDDAGGTQILCLACQCIDRAEHLAELIAKDGAVTKLKGGILKEHPALKHETANRALCARLLKSLGLDVEAIKPPGRPPGFA